MIPILRSGTLRSVRAGIVLTLLWALVLATACGGEDSSSGRKVVAAFYPVAYAAERVAPDADVRNLTPAGSEPHDLELSPRDVEAIHDADVVLYLGAGFMPALEHAAADHENAVDLLAGERLRMATAADGEGVASATRDPHLWLDPLRYARVVSKVAAALGSAAAADPLVAELKGLDRQFRDGLADCERRQIVTSHAAFGYLADAYELVQVPLSGVSPEAEPSPREVEALVDEVRETGATTIFFETLVSPRLAQTVAREAGAETAVLDPLEGVSADRIDDGADYFSIMRANLAALRKGLGCP
jgi:zinc transport system substrate-binding protein